MTDLVMWSALVAFFLPLVIAVIHQPKFPEWMGVTITVIVSIVAGFLTEYFQNGPLHWTNVGHSVLVVLVGAVFFYQHTWKDTANQIKSKTAPASLK